MKALRFDSVGGASGDMILAALIDLGVDPETLAEQLRSLPIEDFAIQTTPVRVHGFAGTRISVQVADAPHPHRGLADIQELVGASSLSETAKARSLDVFTRLAHAEAKVHDTTPDKVHFHEVGAMDSIIDIVGACLALDMLDVTQVLVGPLPLGTGTVKTEHGLLPVPVPATAELLSGHPTAETDEPFELVTPTGAALLMTWKNMDPATRSWTPSGRQGSGFGCRELSRRPNLLRAMLLDPCDQPLEGQACLVLECNIDDTTPELLGSLANALMTKGALDVFTTSVQMKKQRPGTLLTILCKPADRAPLLDQVFAESTTFGVREHLTHRTMLQRRFVEVDTPYGTVRIKVGTWKGQDITRAPEHDDCVRQAEEHQVSVRSVYEAAMKSATAI